MAPNTARDRGSKPQNEPAGWAFVNYSTCVKCFSSRWHKEMRDPWFDGVTLPPPESMGEWRVCDDCGHEWPVERPDIFQFSEMYPRGL
jgi:hypothetical protein